MQKRKLIFGATASLVLLAFVFQMVGANRVASGRERLSRVSAAQGNSILSSPDYDRPTAITTQMGDLARLPDESTKSGELPRLSQTLAAPTVTLRAESGAAILFKTQNGRTVKGLPPQVTFPPHLVLYRSGTLTEPAERTLIVAVSNLPAHGSDITVTLDVWTQHGDPDIGPGYDESISVWRESQQIHNPSGIYPENGAAIFVHEFTEWTASGTGNITTPTDYFRYDVTVTDASHPVTDPLYVFHQDYAFLMENQWKAHLPEVRESAADAAPDELLLYYCDMFPFRKSVHDLSTWLRREEVSDYLYLELVPAMVEAFRVQTDDWGFPWYPAWTNPRPGEDSDQLSIALTDGKAWFHGATPSLANSNISIRVDAGEYGDYSTLTEGIMSGFHHELFHNLQRNISQELGGTGNLMGAEGRWLLFTEGIAMLATSVGQETVQFDVSPGERAYISRANEFLGQGKDWGELNTSYAELLPYRAALYWRFLYEQCGGMKNGVADPAAGMQFIRQTLVTLYSGDVVNIATSTDLVESMPRLMNAVFAQDDVTCPFNNYEDSLLRFAQAIYALRVDDGRCIQPGLPAGCGFYDPNHLYAVPQASTISYSAESIAYAGDEGAGKAGIGSSFGMDFIEVVLDPAAHGQPLRLEFYPAPGAGGEFSVQLWKLNRSDDGVSQRPALGQEALPQVLASETADRRVTYTVPALDTAAYDRVALIISRIDAHENRDPVGEYTITLNTG